MSDHKSKTNYMGLSAIKYIKCLSFQTPTNLLPLYICPGLTPTSTPPHPHPHPLINKSGGHDTTEKILKVTIHINTVTCLYQFLKDLSKLNLDPISDIFQNLTSVIRTPVDSRIKCQSH